MSRVAFIKHSAIPTEILRGEVDFLTALAGSRADRSPVVCAAYRRSQAA
jgi:hypothetical protein